MKIILTEEQYKYILVENTLKDTLKELKISSGILFTFGTGIGAFIGPVDRLLSGSGFSINQKDIILLIITSFALLIKDSEGSTLIEKVKEKGLMPALKGVINFTKNVKDVLNAVAKNLTGVTYSLLDILGFALLLNPTMKILDGVIQDNDISLDNVDTLLKGTALAAIVYSLKTVFGNIKNKFNRKINEDIASQKQNDEPEFFVENELRYWLNDKFLLNPPLEKKPLRLSSGETPNLNENYVRFSDDVYSTLLDDYKNVGLEGDDAILDLDNLISSYENLPNSMILYRLVFSDSQEEIDTQYPGYHYTRKKKDLLDNHYFQSYRDSSTGETPYIIKVRIQKQMIDFYESIKNNILYPGEKEITLKDKGFGSKIIEIMPVNI